MKHYSGNKKHHTVKSQITENTKGKILMVGKSYPGKTHDYNIFKQELLFESCPQKALIMEIDDTIALQKNYSEHRYSMMPIKWSRNHSTLGLSEKCFKKKPSRLHILVEQVSCHMKKYYILVQVYRHKTIDYNLRFRIIAALINFK